MDVALAGPRGQANAVGEPRDAEHASFHGGEGLGEVDLLGGAIYREKTRGAVVARDGEGDVVLRDGPGGGGGGGDGVVVVLRIGVRVDGALLIGGEEGSRSGGGGGGEGGGMSLRARRDQIAPPRDSVRCVGVAWPTV